jgi:hypothetical protein
MVVFPRLSDKSTKVIRETALSCRKIAYYTDLKPAGGFEGEHLI